MTDHPTLEATATVRVCAGEPSGAAPPAAAFVDLVCADHELLRAEFDTIIAANFPDVSGHGQRLRPAPAVATATRPGPARRVPARPARQAVQGRGGATQNMRARQRGPPVQPRATGHDHEAGHDQKGGGGIDRPHIRGHVSAARGRDHPQRSVHVRHPGTW